MSNPKVGDRIKSTRMEGTIIEIEGIEEYDGSFRPEFALVKQDNGKTRWWII